MHMNFSSFLLIILGLYLLGIGVYTSNFLLTRLFHSQYCSSRIVWKSLLFLGINCRGAVFHYYNNLYSDHGIKFVYKQKCLRWKEFCYELQIINLKNQDNIMTMSVAKRTLSVFCKNDSEISEISFLYKIKKQDLFELIQSSYPDGKIFENYYEKDYFF